MTRRTGIASVLATAGIALATISSPALAAVTIGSNLGADMPVPAGGDCRVGGCTFTQQDLPAIVTASGGLWAPSDGVVVRWRIQVGPATHPVALRIVRQPKPLISAMTGAGTGPTVPAPSANQISTFDVRLPIHAGERVGIDHDGLFLSAFAQISNAHLAQWNPLLIDSEPPRSPGTLADTDLLVNADIEPDADADGFGDETQDLCPTDGSTQGPCPVTPVAPVTPVGPVTPKKKCKKHKKKHSAESAKKKKCKKKKKK